MKSGVGCAAPESRRSGRRQRDNGEEKGLHGGFTTGGLEHSFSRSRVAGEFVSRPARPGYQFATAVGADAAEPRAGTIAAEGAFKSADACIGRLVGQVLVAALAVGAQLEHGVS